MRWTEEPPTKPGAYWVRDLESTVLVDVKPAAEWARDNDDWGCPWRDALRACGTTLCAKDEQRGKWEAPLPVHAPRWREWSAVVPDERDHGLAEDVFGYDSGPPEPIDFVGADLEIAKFRARVERETAERVVARIERRFSRMNDGTMVVECEDVEDEIAKIRSGQ